MFASLLPAVAAVLVGVSTVQAPSPVPPRELELSLKVDAPLLAASAAMLGASLLIKPHPATAIDSAKVWRGDRVALGRRSAGQDAASTALQTALVIGAPLALAVSEWGGEPKDLVPAIVVAESIVASLAVSQLTKALVHRPRPYTYMDGTASGDDMRSFYSGHTTVSFAAVTALTLVLHELHPESRTPLYVGLAGFSAAAAVGVLRVTSGKHFPTDVAVGALAGMAIGWSVPKLHRRSWSVSVTPTGVGARVEF